MRAKVYIESSVISYLASRPSRDLIVAARQAVTSEWWDHRRGRFDLYVSALVEEEIAKGDPAVAAKRLEIAHDIPALDISDGAKELAKRLLERRAVPAGSEEDALHIAIAAAAGMNYLLTWNFKHINNAENQGADNGGR
ncbi:type II toxin-antitoxin system VapC family toxin [Thiohalocapsa sp. ML1]|uniref:type II toxin-antitoxin system VapC family toxin n=1 Tax=Thiohalocapsa sp. ML1 TaxID=1431688 RepID=UPI001C1F9872|nr:type II toxin-antitoxin system VapC family toxin [Thiohalocapsa sp. ML1]